MLLNFKVRNRLLFLLFIFSLTCVQAQKRFNVSILIESNIHPDSLIITYDNGLSIVEAKPIFNHKTATISGLYYAPFAELLLKYPNGAVGDLFGTNFYLIDRKAKITLLPYQGGNNPLRVAKTEGVLKPEDVGETDFRQFIDAEQTDFSQFVFENRNQMNDSLVNLAFAKSAKLARRKVDYVQLNSQKYYAFRLFRKDVIYDPNLSADSSFRLLSLFPKQLQESEEGKEVSRIIRGLHLGKMNPAPDIVARNVAGQSTALSNYRGKYVLLNFWASWCGPCLEEMPVITRIRKQYSPHDLVMVFISQDTDSIAFAKAVKKYQLDGEHLFSNSDLIRVYGAAIPKAFVIDPKGQIVYSREEEQDFKLEKLVNMLSTKIKKIP